jgi:hypothetical protein
MSHQTQQISNLSQQNVISTLDVALNACVRALNWQNTSDFSATIHQSFAFSFSHFNYYFSYYFSYIYRLIPCWRKL